MLANWRLWGVAGWGKIPHSTTMRAPTCPFLSPPSPPHLAVGGRFVAKARFGFRRAFVFSEKSLWFQNFCFVFRNTLSGFRNSFSVSEMHCSFQKRTGRFQNLGEGVFLSVSGTQNPFQKIIFVFRNSVSVSEMFFRFQNPCAGFRILASCFRNVAVFCLRESLRCQLGVCLGARFVAPLRVFHTPHREISGRGAPTPGHFGEGAAVPLETRFWPTYHQARCF